MTNNLQIGDKLYTSGEAGLIIYKGDGKAEAWARTNSGSYTLTRAESPLNDAQIARWNELRAEQGAVAHMPPKA